MVRAERLKEHGVPHFHARYGEHRATFAIGTGAQLDGDLPVRAARFVREWLELHRDELMQNWDLARRGSPPRPIDPLP
ncbi:MAG: DUF4160 domain-containing protein [Actinobacteria bacterium]|nr:MAG: DUF4160 domain-containing protein [Actinomycetota bacterium]